MKTVWKFPLPWDDNFSMALPDGAEILTFQVQYGEPTIWALVDPSATMVKRHFSVVGTGHEKENITKEGYIGTVQSGKYVWHLFETWKY